jgi:hypothetical protein
MSVNSSVFSRAKMVDRPRTLSGAMFIIRGFAA